MRYFKLFFIALLIAFSSLRIEAAEHQAPSKILNFDNIKKISDTSYEGTLQERPNLKFIMEKVNNGYTSLLTASDQSARNPGNEYFRRVIHKLSSDYDVWVAYAKDSHAGKKFPNNIHIMMTVTTAPEALLTSHMGIFKTPWSPENSLAIPLHAFAAKVSLMRDSKKKYMVTRPLENMLKIMLAKLPPDSIFLGSKESLQRLSTEKQKIMESIKKELQEKNPHASITQNTLETKLQAHHEFTRPRLDGLSLKEYDDFSKNFHPLLSYKPLSRPREIIIFKESNPEEPWLEISQTNRAYGWLFDSLFDLYGPEAIVINLEKLAALYGP